MKSIAGKLTMLQLVCAALVVAVLFTLINRQLSQRMTENFMIHGSTATWLSPHWQNPSKRR